MTMTRAELLIENDDLRKQLGTLRKSIPNPPAAVPEADAIAACVRALDGLRDYGYYSGGRDNYDRPAIKRVLAYLASRYGVTP